MMRPLPALGLVGYLATIPAANWMIGHVGTQAVADGPHTIPVGFGFSAPSGVLLVGLALVLRDVVQESLGRRWVVAGIVVGSVVSLSVATPALAVASGAAFALGELADFAVYTPLRERRLWLAVALSGLAGAVIDSAVFLWLAFSSLDFIAGNVLGKAWLTGVAAGVAWAADRMQALADHRGQQ